jgi:hypothetical protein
MSGLRKPAFQRGGQELGHLYVWAEETGRSGRRAKEGPPACLGCGNRPFRAKMREPAFQGEDQKLDHLFAWPESQPCRAKVAKKQQQCRSILDIFYI